MLFLFFLAAGMVSTGCFFVGFWLGRRGDLPKEVPERGPEVSRLDVILHNLEAYDGTAAGQVDVPGGSV